MHLARPVVTGFLLGAAVAFVAALLKPHADRWLSSSVPGATSPSSDSAGPTSSDEGTARVQPTEPDR